jgi:hypothetical protein
MRLLTSRRPRRGLRATGDWLRSRAVVTRDSEPTTGSSLWAAAIWSCAVADPMEAAGSRLGRALQAGIARAGERLLAWAVNGDDLAPRQTSISTIRRQGMRARLTGVVDALNEGFLPFFVERASGVLDPGAAGDAGGITWIEVADDAAQLESWLACAFGRCNIRSRSHRNRGAHRRVRSSRRGKLAGWLLGCRAARATAASVPSDRAIATA